MLTLGLFLRRWDFLNVAFYYWGNVLVRDVLSRCLLPRLNFHGRCKLHESDLLWLDSLHWCKVLLRG